VVVGRCVHTGFGESGVRGGEQSGRQGRAFVGRPDGVMDEQSVESAGQVRVRGTPPDG
jgi:hypothetical protein